jgi:thioredoxin 2
MMAPAFEAAACEMRTRARFARVDAEQAPAIASRYRVRSIPTMILFRDGREVNRTSGAVDTGVLLRWVQSEEARSAVPKSS